MDLPIVESRTEDTPGTPRHGSVIKRKFGDTEDLMDSDMSPDLLFSGGARIRLATPKQKLSSLCMIFVVMERNVLRGTLREVP